MALSRLLRLRYLIPIAGLGALAWVFLASQRSMVTPVAAGSAHQVERGQLEATLLVNGLVKPAVTIDVRAEASGLVETVHVNEGDRVTVGQVLVTLDSRVAQTAVQEAEASLRQAEMQETVARLDLDEDTLELRRTELTRKQRLFERGLLSAEELEAAEHQLRLAERSLERARLGLESSGARIEQLRAAVDRARAQLQHATIRSPLDAWVIRRHVEVGSGVAGVSQSTAGGTVLMTLGDAMEASLTSQVTAADARRLRPGMDVRIRLDSDPDRIVAGTLLLVSAAGDVNAQTGLTTFPVTIAVATEEGRPWINIPAQAEIVLGVFDDVLAVPDHCLHTDAEGRTSVTLQADGEPTSRSVDIGVVSVDRVQVLSGVDEGDTLRCRGTGL
jgi:HlyD family secretion protein